MKKKTLADVLLEKQKQRAEKNAKPVTEQIAKLNKAKQRSDAQREANKAKGGQPLKSGR
jgi:hypothetical protein